MLGYSFSFQTPEGWNIDGQYRALCYMRPLAIWAMQWALSTPKLHKTERYFEPVEDKLYSTHDAGFAKVASILKLPKEEPAKSFFEVVYDFTCRRFQL